MKVCGPLVRYVAEGILAIVNTACAHLLPKKSVTKTHTNLDTIVCNIPMYRHLEIEAKNGRLPLFFVPLNLCAKISKYPSLSAIHAHYINNRFMQSTAARRTLSVPALNARRTGQRVAMLMAYAFGNGWVI